MRHSRVVFAHLVVGIMVILAACHHSLLEEHSTSTADDIAIDPATGIPYALVFQFPVTGFDTSDFGFGFGSENDRFCLEKSGGQCVAYGYHLGRDTRVKETPVGTEIVAPADGIVRLSTEKTYGAYGSDSISNPSYAGCLMVLEHEFANGQRVTTLLGHVMCENSATYDPVAKTGNPAVSAIVHRGQYVAHVNHYWAGSGQTTDWHHVHWAMRRGAFGGNTAPFVRGYAKKTEFAVDPSTGIWTHPEWLDPFSVVAANGDPSLVANSAVRHHPSGTLLQDPIGQYYFVVNDQAIAPVTSEVLLSERFNLAHAVQVSVEELGCYEHVSALSSSGPVLLYKRPNSSTVVMSYPMQHVRYDVIRWEALLSWGYDSTDLTLDMAAIQTMEATYTPQGFRLLRPGTLVKADEASEVAIVTNQQTRLPIASAEVFEQLGFAWEQIVSVPQAVLTDVAGPREDIALDSAMIHACVFGPACQTPGGCGGGGLPDSDAGSPAMDAGAPQPDAGIPQVEICNGQDDDGDGQIDEIFQCVLGAIGGVCVTSCNTAGQLVCTAPSCSWGLCKPYAEDCANTIDDDCNGLTDCADPTCVGTATCLAPSVDAGSPPPNNGLTQLHLMYNGPVAAGFIELDAWWQPPNAPTRQWGKVAECVDVVAGDGNLDCVFSLPAGTAPFEFQLALPDGRFWGDESCFPSGGCGSPVGELKLFGPNGQMAVVMVPNNPNNQPYFNGKVLVIP